MSIRRLVLYLNILAFAFLLGVPQAHCATSEEQFIAEMEAHRSRLVEYSILIKNQFPKYFKNVTDDQIRLYLDQHDKPKVQSAMELFYFGYQAIETIATRLSRFHGENVRALDPENYRALTEAIEDLNTIEKVEKEEFFRTHQMSQRTQQELQWLEKIADITDVGLYRTKEMGLVARIYDGALYLEKKGDAIGGQLSRWVESYVRQNRAQQITSGLRCSKILMRR